MPKHMSYKDRFMQKVDQHPCGCWFWHGASGGTSPYGHFKFLGKRVGAHRASYLMFRGEITGGLCVLHRCDNPTCVNPDHLFLGTNMDNTQDMLLKGRRSCGSGVGRTAKLTLGDVHEIRRVGSGYGVATRLAREYGVSRQTISNVLKNVSWCEL